VADIFNIIAANYTAVGLNVGTHSKYVNVDAKSFEGTWSGKYADNSSFSLAVSNVTGFRAKVKYESGPTLKYQDVLIRDNSFRIGDSKFTLTRAGVAQIKTVMTDPATGNNVLNTAYAHQQT
jgi:hypothetical protein